MMPLRLLLLLPAFLIATSGLVAAPTGILAGVAVVDLTPPPGGLRVGYGSPLPSDGVQYPITARVLVLESADTSVAIVTWDLCVASSPALHARMPDLGIKQLLLINTHNHAGPDLDQPDFPAPGATLRADAEAKVFDAIKRAKASLFPAFFAAGEGSIPLGYNRLLRQPEGHAITLFDNPERIPYGPADPTVGVLRVTDATGAVRAVLVNYACHPVVLGPTNRKWSADYPGAMRQAVEAKAGDGAICFFLPGAAGDINPLIMGRSGDAARDLPLVDTMGRTLADEVLNVLDRLKPMAGRADRLLTASTSFTVENRFPSLVKTGESARPEAPWFNPTTRVTVTTLLLNQDVGIVVLPGEPFSQFQLDWRRKAGLPHAFFLGYCAHAGDPWAGYLPDIESAARGGFGASDSTYLAVGTGERLVTEGLAQLYRLQGRLRGKPQRHLDK